MVTETSIFEDVKTGSKDLDQQIGVKVKSLFEKYGLYATISRGTFCETQHILIGDEKNFYEYRIHFDLKLSFDNWIENNYDTLKDALKEKTREELENEYENDDLEANNDDRCEFSVFLPKSKSTLEHGLADASKYLVLLNKYLPSVLEGYFDSNTREFDGIGDFLTDKNIQITNENLNDLTNVLYRLYKDSKFVRSLFEQIGDRETQKLFNDWLKLL